MQKGVKKENHKKFSMLGPGQVVKVSTSGRLASMLRAAACQQLGQVCVWCAFERLGKRGKKVSQH